jgi:hypothetical protein
MTMTREGFARIREAVMSMPHNDLTCTEPVDGCGCAWCASKRTGGSQQVYVALFGPDGNEITGPGYVRQPINLMEIYVDPTASPPRLMMSNRHEITFGPSYGDWGVVAGFGFVDQCGTWLDGAPFERPLAVRRGDTGVHVDARDLIMAVKGRARLGSE